MKSSEFITEAEVTPYKSKMVAKNKLVSFLEGNCLQAYINLRNGGPLLYRGMTNHNKPAIFIDPLSGERRSQNTSNHYTQIIDNSPAFNGWPKRSKSLICTTDYSKANNYGTPYVIMPFDNSVIAVCTGRDIWDTPIDLTKLGLKNRPNFWALNNLLGNILRAPENFTDMVNYFNSPKATRPFKKWASEEFGEVLSSRTEVMPYILSQMTPEKLDMQLLPYKQFIVSDVNRRECWIDSKVVAVRSDLVEWIMS